VNTCLEAEVGLKEGQTSGNFVCTRFRCYIPRAMKLTINPALLLVFLALTDFSIGNSALAQIKPGETNFNQSSSNQDAKKGLDEFNHAFIEACRNMNHDAAAQLWADDGVDLLPAMEPMVGKPEISRWLIGLGEKMKGVKVLQCDVDWRETRVADHLAYEWGSTRKPFPSQIAWNQSKTKVRSR